MKINKTSNSKYGNSTTQLEINELVKNLEKNQIETSEFNVVPNNANKLEIDNNLFNDSSSSNISINNSLLDAETSDSDYEEN